MHPAQLILPFPWSQRFAAVDFLAAPCNAAALTWLARTSDWPGGRLALWGEAGNGKTHLLHVWAEATGAALWRAPTLNGLPVLPSSGGIALDEADRAADEKALLHLLNAAGEAGMPVLLAGRTPPSRWQTQLPDLASRLRAVTAVKLDPPDDELLRALLARLLRERQLAVAETVHEWLLRRLPRTPAALRAAVARLDDAGLASGSPITRVLAASALVDMLDTSPD